MGDAWEKENLAGDGLLGVAAVAVAAVAAVAAADLVLLAQSGMQWLRLRLLPLPSYDDFVRLLDARLVDGLPALTKFPAPASCTAPAVT